MITTPHFEFGGEALNIFMMGMEGNQCILPSENGIDTYSNIGPFIRWGQTCAWYVAQNRSYPSHFQ